LGDFAGKRQISALSMSAKREAKEPKPSLQKEYEKAFIAEKRARFDATTCRAWALLTSKFGTKITQEELLSLAQVLAHELDLDLSREYKRRKELLVKWYDENIETIWPFVETRIVVTGWKGGPIDFSKPAPVRLGPPE
jgi:hypothetical protein